MDLELYNRYKLYSTEELKEITVENGYTKEAEEVAFNILSGNRTEYHQKIQLQQEQEMMELLKKQKQKEFKQAFPSYNDIHQIAEDLRFLKNVTIIFIALFIISCLINLLIFLH